MKIFRNYWLISILMLVMIAATMSSCGRREKIDLSEYLEVDVTGYNGMGKISTHFDYDGFEKELTSAYARHGSRKNRLNALLEISSIENNMEFSFDKTDNLSNGDEITITWNKVPEFESCKQIDICATTQKFTISGLEEVIIKDPFENINFNVEGFSSFGHVNIDSDDFSEWDYSVSKKSEITIGDVVTVSFSLSDEEFLNKHGYIPSRVSCDYHVDQMDKLIEKVSEIPGSLDELMKKELDDYVLAKYANENYETLIDYQPLGYIVLTPKKRGFFGSTHLYLVYKSTIHYEKGDAAEDVEAYKYMAFLDPELYMDGTGYVDLTHYYCPPGGYNGLEHEAFRTSIHIYDGFPDIERLTNAVITANLADYMYDTDIEY